MRQLHVDLTPAQVAGPIGKAFSRVGANASVSYHHTGDALEHLDMATQIDARGDALSREIARLLMLARRTTHAGDKESLIREASEKMAMLMDLDEVEEEHWRVYATERIVTARGLSLRTVEMTEQILTRRVSVREVA